MNGRTIVSALSSAILFIVGILTLFMLYGLSYHHAQTVTILTDVKNTVLWIGSILLLLFVLHKAVQYRHITRMKNEEYKTALAERKRIEQETRVLSMDEQVRKQEIDLKRAETYARVQEVRMQEAKLALELETARIRLMLEQQQSTLLRVSVSESLYHVSNGEIRQLTQGQLPTRAASTRQQNDIPALALPYAPTFAAMNGLIMSRQHLVLAYTNSKPLYGTLEDHLLSMLFTGRPKTGKSTAILYYAAMFLKVGILPIILDPQGSLQEFEGVLPYRNSMQEIHDFLPLLHQEFSEREELWRNGRILKPYAIVVIFDELAMISAWEEANISKDDKYTVSGTLQKIILELRKLEVYTIAASQGFPASVLPTLSRENTSSRLIFPTTDRYARMAGLEEKYIKTLLPQLDAVERGTGILDVGTMKEPYLIHIPYTTIDDVIAQVNENGDYHELIQTFAQTPGYVDTDKHTSMVQVNSREQLQAQYKQTILDAYHQGHTGIRAIQRATGIDYNIVRSLYHEMEAQGVFIPVQETVSN